MAKKPVPRLIHSWTMMISGMIHVSDVNHAIGSVMICIRISALLA